MSNFLIANKCSRVYIPPISTFFSHKIFLIRQVKMLWLHKGVLQHGAFHHRILQTTFIAIDLDSKQGSNKLTSKLLTDDSLTFVHTAVSRVNIDFTTCVLNKSLFSIIDDKFLVINIRKLNSILFYCSSSKNVQSRATIYYYTKICFFFYLL